MFFLESFPFWRGKVITEQKTGIQMPTFLFYLSYYRVLLPGTKVPQPSQWQNWGQEPNAVTPAQQTVLPATALPSAPPGHRTTPSPGAGNSAHPAFGWGSNHIDRSAEIPWMPTSPWGDAALQGLPLPPCRTVGLSEPAWSWEPPQRLGTGTSQCVTLHLTIATRHLILA